MKFGTASPARTGDPQIHNLEDFEAAAHSVDQEAAVLAAFWHRTRREFLPCTINDIVDRSKVSRDAAFSALTVLRKRKEASTTRLPGDSPVKGWFLTAAGKARLREQLEAAE